MSDDRDQIVEVYAIELLGDVTDPIVWFFARALFDVIELTDDGFVDVMARSFPDDDRGVRLLLWAKQMRWRVWFSLHDGRQVVSVETADGAITTTMSDGRLELRAQTALAIELVGMKGGWLR